MFEKNNNLLIQENCSQCSCDSIKKKLTLNKNFLKCFNCKRKFIRNLKILSSIDSNELGFKK